MWQDVFTMTNKTSPHGETPLWRKAATSTLHAALMLRSDVEQRLQDEMGLLLADNEALLRLEAADGGLRMSEISESLVLSRGGTTKVVDRLEAMGLAERRADPEDRRATLVSITADGREALSRARPIIDAALHEGWGAHLSEAEAQMVVDIIERVREANPAW
jgi:DNA-binding MarR family transcriptional regulator